MKQNKSPDESLRIATKCPQQGIGIPNQNKEAVQMNTVKSFIKADNGKVSQVVEYGTGASIEIPINSDGSVKWYKDKLKQNNR